MHSITELEALVRRLAGRNDLGMTRTPASGGRIPDQLDDPSSDASLLLEEIRRRTRALLDEPTDAPLAPSERSRTLGLNRLFPGDDDRSARRLSRLGWMVIVVGLFAGLGLLGGLFLRGAERSVAAGSNEQTERILREIRSHFGAQKEVPRGPLPGLDPGGQNSDLALRRWEVELIALNAKLDALSRSIASSTARPKQPTPDLREISPSVPTPAAVSADPNYPIITADLAAIRRELVNSEAATTRQLQEMRTVLQEVNTVVRRVLSRPQPSANNNMAISVLAVAVQALTNNLQHPSVQVRGEAVEQLVRIGSPARSAIPALQQMLGRETDPNIRSAIETALTVLSSN